MMRTFAGDQSFYADAGQERLLDLNFRAIVPPASCGVFVQDTP
jgi:hypothetical protein